MARELTPEEKHAMDVVGLVPAPLKPPADLAAYITPQRTLVPLQFSGPMPLCWSNAITRAAASGELSFPYSKMLPTWNVKPLFQGLCTMNPFATLVYTTGVAYVPRGEDEPVCSPHMRGRGLKGFMDGNGTFICLKGVRRAVRIASGYSEPARVQAMRKDQPSAVSVWQANAGVIAAQAADTRNGTLTCRSIVETVWERVGFTEVTAFPPEAARACYLLFAAKTVLDPCGGWGDRLAAALSLAPQLKRYVCTDPNPAVHVAYAAMIAELGPLAGADPAKYVHMQTPFEDVPLAHEPGGAGLAINAEPFDLVFTSPPFFDLEVYAQDASQSLERYKPDTTHVEQAVGAETLLQADTPDRLARLLAWFRGFLCRMLERAWARLAAGGYMVLSINDFAGTRYIHAMLAHAQTLPGVFFCGVLGMDLTASATYDGTIKAPLFVWQKQG